VPSISLQMGIRQELLRPSTDDRDQKSAGAWPPQLEQAVAQAQDGQPSRIYLVSLCWSHASRDLYNQTECGVAPDQELSLFVVLGRRRQMPSEEDNGDGDDDKLARDDADQAIELEQDRGGVGSATDHDGDGWLALCTQEAATVLTHQCFVLALAPEGTSQASEPRAQPLARLATVKSADLVGLSVQCPVPGQLASTVPIVVPSPTP
jgi:hypothetical protein